MSTGDNPRFNAGMGSIAMYAAAPVDAPYPGILKKPWPSDPFFPGIQRPPEYLPQQGLTVASGGPEPVEQILSRMRARVGQIKCELKKLDGLKVEMAQLEKMLAAYDAPEDTAATDVQGPEHE